jgi:lysyl-tRNA synthetase class 2
LRGRILQEIRGYFDSEGFLEVETPALVPAPTPEPQIAPLSVIAVSGVKAVTGVSAVAGAGGGYLITSPEFQLKRLLVGGFEKIYRLGPVFRGGEAGERHNPEFTMLEWYRSQTDLEAMAQDLEALLSRLAPLSRPEDPARPMDSGAGQGPELPGNPALAPALERPFKRSTVGALFKHHLGMDLSGITTAPALREAALTAKVPGAGQLPDDFERAFFTLWDRIEPNLGPEPLLVGDWPAPLASLARLKPGDPTLAERMELYAGGYELANGFAELTDAAEQRRRFEADLAARKALGLPGLPLDERFLEALASGMPPASGMALGVERLVMLIGGAKHIRQVMPFTADEL